jgi:enamine deaminase RidA (YjgF/YER057c/UK114 family)
VSVVDRLAGLGIELPQVAAPVAAYVPAVRSGSYVHTSGQLPFVAGDLPATGKVGTGPGQVSPQTATELARTAALNAVAAVASLIGDLDRVARVVKVTGFVASDPGFTGQPGVINGASTLLHDVFGEAGVHARSAVGVAVLPLDSPVEVEIVVELTPEG